MDIFCGIEKLVKSICQLEKLLCKQFAKWKAKVVRPILFDFVT